MTYETDTLTTRLKAAATQETRECHALDPAAVIRRRAEHARARRRAVAVSLGVAAAVAGAVVFQQATASDGLFTMKVDQAATNTPAPSPTGSAPVVVPPSPAIPTGAPSASTSSAAANATDDAPTTSNTGTAGYPAPPTAHVEQPWTREGSDYGDIVAARMEDGHAVITVDRVQIFTAEQWKAETGEDEPMDFHMVNESTRTRQFVVGNDALLYGNWLLNSPNNVTRKYTPQELVQRINAELVKQANNAVAGSGIPHVPVFLFHRDRLDGTVAYLEEASQYTG